eukprot:GDKI01029106.1.p1 GENE.GDKI01029106.1~~GDKI01029106.1.p1  ORF type:complete len:199 (-),score=63.12 GDKI01029106.1:20-616(-)
MKTLNNAARIHLPTVQRVLGGCQSELYHILVFALDYCHWRLDSAEECRELLHEALFLIGYHCALCPPNQTIMAYGEGTSLLSRLSSLPLSYFVDEKLRLILFPTLLSAIFGNSKNLRILQADFNILPLKKFVANQMVAQEKERGGERGKEQLAVSDGGGAGGLVCQDGLMAGSVQLLSMPYRFPYVLLEKAAEFLQTA